MTDKLKRSQKQAYEKQIKSLRALANRQLSEIKKLQKNLCWKNLEVDAAEWKQERAEAERDALAAKVEKVERGEPITKIRTVMLTGYREENGVFAADGSNLYRKKMAQADIPYDHCPVCGAVLCSRWHNFCGKCGTKMEGGRRKA